ncbi:hypothetical protein CO116_01825 [Candidatus Falkowbacteria bacterium CG_4_9_14_3_um_filter_38_19]|uniref:Uncharacterized protein n=1 Tax=Candidatus Falkowbacteria bacterium CG_4_9_14_3_um_filter_38_19 TaxID=1974559 RepID=A0A2M8AH28_9BACT|nr:MAG: hypothetical protein CO116_01825 [Candidatus Falkowbacteria bacterium CG_4_9_14_3_um_filter_38_19]
MRKVLLITLVAIFFLVIFCGQIRADEKQVVSHQGSVVSLCLINANLADRLDEILDNYEGDVVHFYVYSRDGSETLYIIPTSDFFKSILYLVESGSYEEEYEQWEQELLLDEMRLRVILKKARAGLNKPQPFSRGRIKHPAFFIAVIISQW